VSIAEVQEMGDLEYEGRFVPLAAAAQELRGEGLSGWQFSSEPQQRPTLVGEPVYALILGR
jgi:hypothetical protein